MLPLEILDQIAPFLDFQSRLSCLYVNRLWNSAFAPWLWHTLPSGNKIPWKRLFRPAGSPEYCCRHDNSDERKLEELRAFWLEQLRKYGQFIRHATCDSWSVVLLLQAKSVTQLRSLAIYGYRNWPHSSLSAQALTELLLEDGDTPKYLFQENDHDSSSVALARACWQLIAKNPNLTSATFKWSCKWTLSPFFTPVMSNMISSDSGGTFERVRDNDGVHSDVIGDNSNELRMTPTDYLINIISSLPKLSHIHLMPSSFELVLPALARGLLPTIRSYVYSNGDMNALDNLVPLLSSPCTTLESLRILTPIPIRHLRSILSIFPALKSLEIRYCEANPGELPLYAYSSVTSTPGGNTTTSNMDPIIHTGIERISFLVIYGLLDAGVQFPNLKRISQIGEVQHVRQLLFILRSFPTLEHLEIRTLGGQDSRRESKQSIKKEDGGPRLKSLVIQAHQPRPRTMTRILATMPNLVRLELRNITLDTLTQLSTAGNYLHLQYVRFNLSKPYYKETNQLFVNCPNLKSIQGLGIAVWAEDMIQEPLWTCLGLQKFHCEIHGVPRLSQDEEELLLEKGIDLNSSNNYYDHHDNIQQIVEQHQHSLLIQRRVYQQLARLTNLRYLDVGFPSRRYRKYAPSISIPTSIALGGYGTIRWYGRPVPDTLSFSLAYALDELKTLQRLDTFGFKAVNHQIGEGELQWMARHWRFLKTVYGLDAHKDGVLCDKKADALGKRLEELIPGVKLKVFRYQDSFDDEAFF